MQTPSPDEMLAAITKMFPDFDRYWRTEGLSMDESGWSDVPYHSLFAEFSRYFNDNILKFPDAKIQEFCDYIEMFVRDDDIHESLDNAICTCFLENVGGNPIENHLCHFLRPKSLFFHKRWHGDGKKL